MEVKKGSGLFICYVCDILAKDPGPVLAGVEENCIHLFLFPCLLVGVSQMKPFIDWHFS